MRFAAVLLVLTAVLSGCAEKETPPPSPEGLSGTCGLRKVAPDVKEAKVREEFLLEGAEIARTQIVRDAPAPGGEDNPVPRFIATINLPYAVDDAYRSYLEQIREAGWKLTTHETEGFEAEIYFSNDDHFGAVVLRTSTCEGKTVNYATLIPRR